MRILALTNLYPNPYQPNRATFNRQQLRALAEDHSIRIIAPILWTAEMMARIKGKRPFIRQRRLISDGIPVVYPCYYYPPWILRGWHGIFYRNSVSRWFGRILSEFSPDLLFALWAYPDGWAACELARKAGLPVVVKVHGSDILTLQQYPSRLQPTVEALQRADGIVAVSQDLANRVIGFGVNPLRVRVVYDGINEGLFHRGSQRAARERLGLDLFEPVVLYVGRLVPIKGLEILLEACAELVRQGHRFVSYLIGEGPLQSRLERMVKCRHLGKYVRFLGPKPHDQLPDWYRAATVCVLPSYSEGVPIMLLEAAACGIPFVASQVGGIPEIAHLSTSQLVPPGDPLSLAQAIGKFISGSSRCSGSGVTSIRSHAQAASELTSFFEEILHAHGQSSSLQKSGAV
jgi:glycosyltransferase involved in cell wall biosynthesis